MRRSSEPPAGEGVSEKMRQFEALLVQPKLRDILTISARAGVMVIGMALCVLLPRPQGRAAASAH